MADEPGYSTTEIVAIRPVLPLCSEYCALALRRPDFVDYVTRLGQGTKMPRLRTEDAVVSPFPLPPLAEQNRIVAKVEELMAMLDRLEAARGQREATRDQLNAASLARLTAPDTTPEKLSAHARFALDALPALTTRADQIKSLRQTILNLAVRGKLVAQDPAERSPDLPHQTNRDSEGGKLDFALPSNWHWAHVSEVASARLGKMLDRAKNKGTPYPYLRNTNVHWFEIRTDNVKHVPLSDDEAVEYLLAPGDVLICEGGHGIGRSAVWRGSNSPMAFQKALHRVRVGKDLDPDFFSFCCFVYFHEGVMQTYFTGVGIPHFTGRALSRLIFPLPPIAEQHRIVAKVAARLAVCDRLEAALDAADITRARLLGSLLHEALTPASAPELEAA